MAAGEPSGRNPFDGLPDGTLGIIAGLLGIEDRVCFLSCCRATRRYQLSSHHSLFSDLALPLESTTLVGQFVVWLAGAKQQLGRLSLSWDGSDSDVSALGMLLLGTLADSSLHTLSLHLLGTQGRLQLGAWLSVFQRLRSLSVIAGKVQLGEELSSLTALTRLSLAGTSRPVIIPPRALPPRLEELSINLFDAASLGEALLAAGPLRHLKSLALRHPNEPWQSEAHWDALAAHTQLTSLTLKGWRLEEMPWQLGWLTALREFCLSGARLAEWSDSLDALASLGQLTSLSLPDSGLGLVPASVLALPALQDLDLKDNYLDYPLPFTSAPRLTRLALDVHTALDSAEALTALSALRTLVLTKIDLVESEVSFGDAGGLIHTLSELPSFAELDARLVDVEPNPFYAAKEVLLRTKALPFVILAEW